MKKILILVLLLAPFISGCSVTKVEPKDEVTFTVSNDDLFRIELVVGEQITPGKISITVDDLAREEEERLWVGNAPVDELLYRVIVTEGGANSLSADSVDYDKDFQPITDFTKYASGNQIEAFSRLKVGETDETNIDVKDGDYFEITDTPLQGGCGRIKYFDPKKNFATVTVKSDGSGEYDDSWKVENENLEDEITVDQNYTVFQSGDSMIGHYEEYVPETEFPEIKIGENFKGGYLKVTCNSATDDMCSIIEYVTTTPETKDKTYTYNRIRPNPSTRIKVGESVVIPYLLTSGNTVTIEPSSFLLDKEFKQNITLQIVDKY